MNAAAKVINQSTIFNGELANMRFSVSFFWHMVLLLTVLISALAVVYTTNMHRLTFSELERAQQESHRLELQWGQLLLEQASLSTPSRVEQLANDKLHMVLPNDKQTYVLHVK